MAQRKNIHRHESFLRDLSIIQKVEEILNASFNQFNKTDRSLLRLQKEMFSLEKKDDDASLDRKKELERIITRERDKKELENQMIESGALAESVIDALKKEDGGADTSIDIEAGIKAGRKNEPIEGLPPARGLKEAVQSLIDKRSLHRGIKQEFGKRNLNYFNLKEIAK
jgi:hypothetical protein